jgi:chorismate synthase
MSMLRFLTAGESHGKSLTAVIDGVPSNLEIKSELINAQLRRRQQGYGRGGRMAIEIDAVEITGGVRAGKTLGSPLSLIIRNKDWDNWQTAMDPEENNGTDKLTRPRPGHADLSGMLKYDFDDARNVLERASARETAARVAVGAVAKIFLAELEVYVESCVTGIGKAVTAETVISSGGGETADKSCVRCLDGSVETAMMAEIDKAGKAGDTLGGTFEIAVFGLPAGIGSYSQWDKRLDARIAKAIISIPAIKGIEFGDGFSLAERPGSEAHDEIFYEAGRGYFRKTNRAGGLEAGMTDGSAVRIRAAMKPIPTLKQKLATVDIDTKKPAEAIHERSDVCAVPAASIVAEAVVAIEIMNAILEKFGGDAMQDIKRTYHMYLQRIT